MAWQTPKTDWDTDDGITTTDLDRWEENTRILKQGGDHGSSIAAGNNLTVTKNSHLITGGGEIRYISTGGWGSGARVTLIIQGSATLKHNYGAPTSPPTGFAAMFLTKSGGGGEVVIGTGKELAVEFIYDGTYWRSLGVIANVE
jgi:hypothetical protein